MPHTIEIREGGALRVLRDWAPDGIRQSLSLTPDEQATVTDWNNLEIWFTADGGTQAIRVRRAKGRMERPSTLTVEFRESGALIGTRELLPLTPWPGDSIRQEIEFTPEEQAAVSNWANVQLWFTADGGERAWRIRRVRPAAIRLPAAIISDTILAATTEADLVAGGKLITITLENATWIP